MSTDNLPLEEAAPALDESQANGVVLPEDPPSSQTDDSQSDDTQESPAQERPKSQFPGFQKRIDKLTWEKNEIARELAATRELLKNTYGNQRQPEPEPVKSFDNPPSPLDYESGIYDAKYQQDFQRYQQHLINQAVEQRLSHQRQQAEYAQTQQWLADTERQYTAQNPDYAEAKSIVLSIPEIAQNPDIGKAILDSDNPHQLIHFLGRNPEMALQIAEMSSTRAVKELGKIEAKLSGLTYQQQQPSEPAQPVQAFRTPAPVKPLSGGKTSRVAANIHEARDYSEFKKLWNSGKR